MYIAPAAERKMPECLTYENILIYAALQDVHFILACYIILDILLLSTQRNLRVKTNFELKECQNGRNHLKETGNL
jgi:hypothetical protein